MSKTDEYPSCSNCGNAMVWSFAFRGYEWVCLPCDTHEPMFHSRPLVKRLVSGIQAKKRKWSSELSVIARRFGGGKCARCDDGTCDICLMTNDKNFKFSIWKSRAGQPLLEKGKE